SRGRLEALVRRFRTVRVLVVGDLMLDRFIWGRVERISPEAPVPVVHVTDEDARPGGAGNVASNVAALGGRPGVSGVVGGDAAGKRLGAALQALGADTAGIVVARHGDTPDDASLRTAGERLLARWEADAVLISRGEEGMALFKRGGGMRAFPTLAHEVFDVTGAGDTVLATCALALGAGGTLEEATVLANHAAGVVVGKIGTATVAADELARDVRRG